MLFSRHINKRNQRLQKLVSTTGQHAFQLALQYTNDSDAAKDIVQKSLLKLMEHLHLPDEGINYWFLKVVRNTALDYTRHQGTRTRLANDIKVHTQIHQSARSDKYEETEQSQLSKKLIEDCLRKLSQEYREIIVLKDLHDYSYEQIAKILDIAKGTVMSRLHRARLALKNEVLNYETN